MCFLKLVGLEGSRSMDLESEAIKTLGMTMIMITTPLPQFCMSCFCFLESHVRQTLWSLPPGEETRAAS